MTEHIIDISHVVLQVQEGFKFINPLLSHQTFQRTVP